MNLDSLGGYDDGPGGGDNVVQRLGPRVGVWGRPGVWPGDGGWVYLSTAGGGLDAYQYGVSGTGQPSLSFAGTTADQFGWGSGPAVVTSNGTADGSALVWVIWSANRQGQGAQLRAYDPIPVDGQMQLVYSAPIGTSTNYFSPGVGGGRLYVGTRDGHILAFGSPVSQPLSGPTTSFPSTPIGETTQKTLTLTASQTVTINSLASTSGQFILGAPSQSLPATLTSGQTISVPVTFAPTQTGLLGDQVNVTLSDGRIIPFSLSATGEAPTPLLSVNQQLLSLGGTTVGRRAHGKCHFLQRRRGAADGHRGRSAGCAVQRDRHAKRRRDDPTRVLGHRDARVRSDTGRRVHRVDRG